jgi:ABC-2 type transport system ATP-binding protein
MRRLLPENADALSMISVSVSRMAYPVPKRYRELLRHPLRPRRWIEALRDVELRIKEGERVAIVGPNGAGKTTLLKLLGGLLYPTSGRIEIDGVDTVEQNLLVRRSVGVVINEERSFYWRLTGLENLEFFGVLENLGGPSLRSRMDRLLALVGLSEAADRRVSDYSSGMRQRLAIARGLLTDPKILLLDEPTRSLDPAGAREIRKLVLGEIHAKRCRTVVVATNRFDDVTELCDRLVMIHRGTVVRSVDVGNWSEQSIASLYHTAVDGGEPVR